MREFLARHPRWFFLCLFLFIIVPPLGLSLMPMGEARIVLESVLFFGCFLLWAHFADNPSKWECAVNILLLVLFLVMGWLWFEWREQTAPHHITQSINGHVINEFWTTNPVYVTHLGMPVNSAYLAEAASSGGRLVTNEYWHVWSIFKGGQKP